MQKRRLQKIHVYPRENVICGSFSLCRIGRRPTPGSVVAFLPMIYFAGFAKRAVTAVPRARCSDEEFRDRSETHGESNWKSHKEGQVSRDRHRRKRPGTLSGSTEIKFLWNLESHCLTRTRAAARVKRALKRTITYTHLTRHSPRESSLYKSPRLVVILIITFFLSLCSNIPVTNGKRFFLFRQLFLSAEFTRRWW